MDKVVADEGTVNYIVERVGSLVLPPERCRPHHFSGCHTLVHTDAKRAYRALKSYLGARRVEGDGTALSIVMERDDRGKLSQRLRALGASW